MSSPTLPQVTDVCYLTCESKFSSSCLVYSRLVTEWAIFLSFVICLLEKGSSHFAPTWPQICNLPCLCLGLQACTTTSFLYQDFVKFFAKRLLEKKHRVIKKLANKNKGIEASMNSSYLFSGTPNKRNNKMFCNFWKLYETCHVIQLLIDSVYSSTM